ncbi:MAG: ABC transporter substrate-binding protein [Acidimicrobiia bacterium]
MRGKWKLVVLLLAFALVAAACGDDDDTTATTAAATTAAPAATTAAPDTTAAPGTTAAPDTTTATTEAPMEILTDVGVDLDAGVIRVGLLSDLTGPFGALVAPIVTGHEIYWEDVNASGGVNGLQVELVIEDTQYVVDNHVQLYEELKDQVVAFGHSTGSPHTVAIREALEEDGIFAIPLTWYSGWSDPALNANLLSHGVPYCIEAMNLLDYISTTEGGSAVAIASLPGDYGLDSAAGANLAADALGLDVVYDGSGQVIPGQDLKPIADAIVASGADIVFVTATPGTFSEIYGQAIAQGFVAKWSGALPSWNPAYVQPESAIKDAIERDWIGDSYIALWSSDGAAGVRDLVAQYRPDQTPHDFIGEGVVEATMMHQILLTAYDNGDMTQAGLIAAAKSIDNLDFGGLAPSENYTLGANERLQRTSANLFRPSQADAAAGGTGVEIIAENYTSPTAEAYTFESACFQL